MIAGTLQLGNGSASGSLGTGAVTNNGTLVFDRSDTGLTVSSVISGSGSLVQNGSGTTTLSGNNTYSGGTTINTGTLDITKASGIGSGTVTVNSGALTVNYGSAGYTFSNTIVGSASGTVNLDGCQRNHTHRQYFEPGSLTGFDGTVTIDTEFNNIYYQLTPQSGTTFNGSTCNWVVNNQNSSSFVYTGAGVTLVNLGELSGNGTIAACCTGSTLEVGGAR